MSKLEKWRHKFHMKKQSEQIPVHILFTTEDKGGEIDEGKESA